MNNELFLMIIKAVLTIIMGLISAYIIPTLKTWIRERMTDAQLRNLEKVTECAIRSAEQYYSPEEWKEKKEFVFNYIASKINEYFMLSLTEQDIDVLIEGLVNEVKKGN